MIYLYDSTETDFRYNGKPLPSAYDVTVSNTLNSEYYVVGKHPLDNSKTYKEIIEDRIIKVHTMDGMDPFRIVNVSKRELYVEFEAWPLFYADMRNKLVKPLSLRGVGGQAALSAYVNNLLIDTPFSFHSDITATHDYHTQDSTEKENNPKQLYNALDVFKTIVSRWGGELWIRGYDIRVNKRIGTDTEAMLYEKKNISEFVDTTNIEGIVTRLHGKSEWQDEPQEGEEGQKHSIETTIDSPLINDYSGVIFEKQYTNNDIRTEQELINWLNLKFTTENIDKPQRTIEVGTNVIDETKIGFADTLILKYIKHDTDVRIKVVGYEYDGFANELKHVVLGQPKHTSSSTIGNTITDLVNNVLEPVDRKTTIAMNSADGKSTVFHGTADPNTLSLNAKENDTYFRTNGSEKEIWRFTGTLWELIMDTSDTTKNADAIAEQQQEIDDAKEAADEAVDSINSAVVNAGFTSLDETINSVQSISNSAQANAQTAINNSIDALGDASTALTNAQTALNKADSVTGDISDINLEIDDINSSLSLKANQTTVDTLTGRVSTAETDITANSTAIALKANQSTVDTLTGRVSTAETGISANATAIGLKASQSSVDTLTGTVNTLSGRVDVTSGQISSKVWNTDIETAVDGIEVGGRNFLTIGGESKGIPTYLNRPVRTSAVTIEPLGGGEVEVTVTGSNGKYGFMPLSLNESHDLEVGAYTISGEIYFEASGADIPHIQVSTTEGGSWISTNHELLVSPDIGEWQRFSATFEVTERYGEGRYIGFQQKSVGDKHRLRKMKLEKGNKSTDWTPAPEDTTALINHVETELTQKHDAIEATVSSVRSDLTGTTTLLNTTRTTVSGHTSTIATLRTDVDGKATTAQFNTLNSTVNGTIQRVGTAEGKITQIETNVSGLQTTVASKASQTQVTQLANGLSSVVTDFNNLEIGGRNLLPNTSEEWVRVTVAQWGWRSPVYSLSDLGINVGEEITLTAGILTNGSNDRVALRLDFHRADGSYIAGTLGDTITQNERYGTSVTETIPPNQNVTGIQWRIFPRESYWGYNAFYGRARLTRGNVTVDWTPAPQDVQSQITQNASNINLRVKKGDVVSQLNIDANRTLISSSKILLNASTVTISGTAWMSGAVITNASITGAKIADATIGSAKIASLDAGKITTGILDGITVRSHFDYAFDGSIRNRGTMAMTQGSLTLSGNFTHSFGSTYMYVRADRIYAESLTGDNVVRSMFSIDGDGLTVNKLGQTAYYRQDGVTFPAGDAVIQYYDANARIEIGSYNGVTLSSVQKSNGVLLTRLSVGGGNDGVAPFVDIYSRLNMRLNVIDNANTIYLKNTIDSNSGSRLLNTSDNWLYAAGRWGVKMGHVSEDGRNVYDRAAFGLSDIKFYVGLNMQGNNVTNQSDLRLKRDILDTDLDSLSAIESWRLVDFNWKDSELNERNGRQLGLIAQNTPEIATYDVESGIWSINSSKQIMMNTHAIQQLASRELNTNMVASQALQLGESNKSEIDELREENKELRTRIEELESAA